jgi:hypothetical protein
VGVGGKEKLMIPKRYSEVVHRSTDNLKKKNKRKTMFNKSMVNAKKTED